MAIREAAAADVEALLALYEGYLEFYEVDPPRSGVEEMVRELIDAPEERGFVLVAEDERGTVIGFATSQWKWASLRGARSVVLDDLFVAADARGQGHADALIEAVAEVARRHGATSISWLTMPDNKRAHTVYDRVGGKAETLLEYELDL